ncbi:unnamed protein product [Owenia fusiformis]|uniref:F5/8 type C domain-containing protein n=1 Tax=Owenia fusiformis TaxID=6347 RepID=A0A8S4NPX1_OWEFU|nr:unnamed protein product [Owenia fusiformis]
MNHQLLTVLFVFTIATGAVDSEQWLEPKYTWNVAEGKPTMQSSNYYGYNKGFSNLAVDGNPDDDWYHGSCTHTRNDVRAWWMVDLQATYTIYSVKVVNCRNSAPSRLSNFKIEVSNNMVNWILCHHQTGGLSSAWELYYCQASVSGRYVRIQLQGQNYLTLCEVEVNVHNA